jgi:hypothetical protein
MEELVTSIPRLGQRQDINYHKHRKCPNLSAETHTYSHKNVRFDQSRGCIAQTCPLAYSGSRGPRFETRQILPLEVNPRLSLLRPKSFLTIPEGFPCGRGEIQEVVNRRSGL